MKLKLFILLIITLTTCLNIRAQNKYAPKKPLIDSGQVFNFVDMRDMNGKTIKASALRSKIIVFNFWFIACPPCRYEIPELDKLAKGFSDNRDIVFISISTDKENEIRDFLKTNAFGYRHVTDGKALQKKYGIETNPLSLVVDRGGTIVFNSYGYGIASVPGRLQEALQNLVHKKSSP